MKGSNGAFIASGVSVSLVLMLVGAALYFYVGLNNVKNMVLEEVGVSVILNDDITAAERGGVDSALTREKECAVREWKYLSKDDAAAEFQSAMGMDYSDVLQGNPLPASYELKLKSDSVFSKSVERLAAVMRGVDGVQQVVYGKQMVDQLSGLTAGVNSFILVLGGALLFVAIILIYNTIALSIAARATAIETMILVGATLSFIRRPFLVRAAVQGAVAGLAAALVLVGAGYILSGALPMIWGAGFGLTVIFAISSLQVVLGMIICLIFTAIAVNRQVRYS